MKPARKPHDEKRRLETLEALQILDTLPERDFDQITFLASQICGTPIALISLIDGNRQWFKSKVGLKAPETSRDLAFCAHAILGEEIFLVPDSSKDERFFDNPLVTGSPHVSFYAGAPLKAPDGMKIGTVCVIDTKPRELTEGQIESLKMLSEQVTRLLQLRKEVELIKRTQDSLQVKSVAIETILEGVVVQDKTGAIINFNPAASSILNLTADQLLSKTSVDPSWKAIKEDGSDFQGQEHPAMVCLRTGTPQKNIVMGVRTSPNEVRWIKINSAPIFQNDASLPNYVVSSFADVTEQIVAKETIEKKRKNLRFILDGVPSMIGLWSAEQVNLNANNAYLDFFNKSPDQVIGLHMKDLFGEELYQKNLPYIKRVLSGEMVTFERKLSHKDGSEHHVIAKYLPNFEGNKVSSFLAVITDVTELKNLEKSQLLLKAKVAESAKLAALGEMAAGIAHEINSPLAIIKTKSAMLVRKANENTLDRDLGVKHLQIIVNTVDRIAKIIKALRTYSRDAENDQFVKVSINETISETLELCRERFRKSGVEIRLHCEPGLEVNSRPPQISQVLMNLLNNSFDAISALQSKWIEIRGFKKDGFVLIQITDSGTGIPAKVAERMMNPFFSTKEVGKGTGLGLSISSGILESHGGSLKYLDGYKNTAFLISIPEYIGTASKKSA